MTIAYPLHHLREEVAFLAYHFHWGLAECLELPHADRVGWVGAVSRINQQIIDAQEKD